MSIESRTLRCGTDECNRDAYDMYYDKTLGRWVLACVVHVTASRMVHKSDE